MPLQFWRTQTLEEVDFVISYLLAIEVKATTSANFRIAKTLKQFSEEYKIKKSYLISRDPIEKIESGIHFIHYETFLKNLWAGSVLTS